MFPNLRSSSQFRPSWILDLNRDFAVNHKKTEGKEKPEKKTNARTEEQHEAEANPVYRSHPASPYSDTPCGVSSIDLPEVTRRGVISI